MTPTDIRKLADARLTSYETAEALRALADLLEAGQWLTKHASSSEFTAAIARVEALKP